MYVLKLCMYGRLTDLMIFSGISWAMFHVKLVEENLVSFASSQVRFLIHCVVPPLRQNQGILPSYGSCMIFSMRMFHVKHPSLSARKEEQKLCTVPASFT